MYSYIYKQCGGVMFWHIVDIQVYTSTSKGVSSFYLPMFTYFLLEEGYLGCTSDDLYACNHII